MGANSKIEWTNHTFNPWIGCTKVGPPCDNCYAESINKRTSGGNWGFGAPRKRTSESYWKQPIRWNREAEATDKRPRVFCGSMCDWADNEVPREWQDDLLELIAATPFLRWQLLSKRGPNIPKIVPDGWFASNQHVGVMLTTGNQDEVDRDLPRLLKMKADMRMTWVGLSVEPMLGPVDLRGLKPDWVICGGESGPHARPMHPDWARLLRDQCLAAGIPYFFKQWGEHKPCEFVCVGNDGEAWRRDPNGEQFWFFDELGKSPPRIDHVRMSKVGKRRAGRLLDGREWNEFPEAAHA